MVSRLQPGAAVSCPQARRAAGGRGGAGGGGVEGGVEGSAAPVQTPASECALHLHCASHRTRAFIATVSVRDSRLTALC